jgi:hypothetical protein
MVLIPSQTMGIPVLHCKLVGGLVTKSDACSADLTNNTTSLVFLFLWSSSGIWKRVCRAQGFVWAVLPFQGAKEDEETKEKAEINIQTVERRETEFC